MLDNKCKKKQISNNGRKTKNDKDMNNVNTSYGDKANVHTYADVVKCKIESREHKQLT